MSSKEPNNKPKRVVLKNGETLVLTERMYLFAVELARTGNEDMARKAAQYTAKGFANKRVQILKRIDPLLFQLQQETERLVVMDKARIIDELSHVALANPLDYLHPDGRPKQLRELTREQAAAIAQFEVVRKKNGETTTTYKLHDKMKALEMGGRHFGMFSERLIMQGRVEHIHRHKHEVIDITKVPSERLGAWEQQLLEEAERQGVTLNHETGQRE